MAHEVAGQSGVMVVSVPISFRKRGGLKQIIAPDGVSVAGRKPDGALIKAVARAFRWRKKLESGVHATLAELAAAEKINPSYVSRVLRLTLLAPDIVEAILDGRQPPALTLAKALRPFQTHWVEQMKTINLQ
jgi:hypothetical protein